jgi:hypothetical protein
MAGRARRRIGTNMHRFFAVGALALLLLTACGAEENPVLGKWRGQATSEQLDGLMIPSGDEPGTLIAEFTTDRVSLNGQLRPVEHKKNEETRYINEIGTNRTMAAQFPEPDRMKLSMPHRFKADIVVLHLTRMPASP